MYLIQYSTDYDECRISKIMGNSRLRGACCHIHAAYGIPKIINTKNIRITHGN